MAFDPRRHRSVSQLSAWTKCQKMFHLERLDKRPSPPAAWTILGQSVHGAFEDWEKSGRVIDPVDSFLLHWEANLEKARQKYPDLTVWTRTPRTKSTESDLALRKEDGIKQVLAYTASAVAQSDLWRPLVLPDGQYAVELPFKLELTPDLVVMGYIDLVQQFTDGTLAVVDYKTAGESGAQDREEYRQLGLYKVALEVQYGLTINNGRYIYTKLERDSGWIDLSRYTKQYITDTFVGLDDQIEFAKEKNVYLPNPSKKGCFFCGVKQFCSEMADR